MRAADPLRALALVCTLTPSPEPSSTDLLARQVRAALAKEDVVCDVVRVRDHAVAFGVGTDEGDDDAWPALRRRVLEADILVVATPIWLGQPSSVCKVVLERLDAELGETDGLGRLLTFGKVAIVAVVGNEDGAHHVSAELYQALSDVGFTVPAQAVTYWVGEAMAGTDYRELPATPAPTAGTTATAARHAAHLARLLRAAPYPPADGATEEDVVSDPHLDDPLDPPTDQEDETTTSDWTSEGGATVDGPATHTAGARP